FRDVRRRASLCSTRPVTPEVAGSSPVAPAFDTALLFAATSQFVDRREVAQERFPRLHRDDRAAVLPDAIEQGCEEPTALRRVVFELPHAAEVGQKFLRLVEPRVKRRRGEGKLLLERLPAEDVLALREVAHHVEIAQPL